MAEARQEQGVNAVPVCKALLHVLGVQPRRKLESNFVFPLSPPPPALPFPN